MQFTEAKLGRVFILRLHDCDRLPNVLEMFAAKQGISSAVCFLLGGARKDSCVVVGPRDAVSDALPVEAVVTLLSGVSEICGVGTIFQNQEGTPTLHMHASFGRGKEAITGCVRKGVDIWRIGEVIILELESAQARRIIDKTTGFELLEVKEKE